MARPMPLSLPVTMAALFSSDILILLVRLRLVTVQATPACGPRRTTDGPDNRDAGLVRSPAPDPTASRPDDAPSRSRRWSPTRSALAIAVRAGFTAPMLGKKLVSTTYRLSSSWALQFTSRTEVDGSVPNRTVPAWWAQPGDRDLVLEIAGPRQQVVRVHPEVIEHRLELAVEPLLRLLVVRRVGQPDVAVAGQRHPVVGRRQVLGRQPEVDRVGGDIGRARTSARAWSGAASRP